MRASPLKHQHGADIVEFALTLPMMLLLFVIFVEFGVAFADKAVITDASRAAAREVIRGGTDAQAYTAAGEVLQSVILWTGTGPYTCDATKCPIVRDGANPGDEISATVRVPFRFRWLPNFVGGIANLDLSGQTVMRMLPH
jgi:hypothetical protein